MANVLFMGDAHLGHQGSLRWRPQFNSMREYVDLVFGNYRAKVTKRDIVYWMGDACMDADLLPEIAALPGTKILILGNHDVDRLAFSDLLGTFDDFAGLLKYKEFWLSHAPIHPDELRNKVNIHGHVHTATLADPRYVNTSMENINFSPVSLDAIRKQLATGKVFTMV